MSNTVLPSLRLSWLGALRRGCSPRRWGLCLLGVLLTYSVGLLFVTADGRFPGFSFEQSARNPFVQFLPLLRPQDDTTSVGLVKRSMLFAILLWPVWSWIGAWIARSELEGQHQRPLQPSPSQLVRQHLGPLAFALPLLAIILFGVLCPVLFVGFFNRFPFFGIGSFLVALAFPALLILASCVLLVLLGAFTFGLMPSALAAEQADAWEGASRSLAYGFNQPLLFLVGEVVLLAVALLPVGVVAWGLTNTLHGLPATVHAFAWLVALALVASLFWSLHTPYYLLLRRRVDEVETDEVYEQPTENPQLAVVGQPDQPDQQDWIEQIDEEDDDIDHQDDENLDADGKVPEPEPEQLLVPSPPRSFWGTLSAGWAANAAHFFQVAPALAVNVLLVLATQEGIWYFSGRANSWTERGRSVLALGQRSPHLLACLVAGSAVLGALILARPLLMLTRRTLITLLRDHAPSWSSMRPSVDAISPRPWFALVGWTIGGHVFLFSVSLIAPVVARELPWQTPALLGVIGLALVALFSMGLAARVCDPGRESTLGLLAQGPLHLGWAAILNIVWMCGTWLLLTAWLVSSWVFLSDLLVSVGGEQTQWIRLVANGRLFPDVGQLYWLSSRIIFLWMVALIAYLTAFPMLYSLCSGSACYLLLRQGTHLENEPFELTIGEYRSLVRP